MYLKSIMSSKSHKLKYSISQTVLQNHSDYTHKLFVFVSWPEQEQLLKGQHRLWSRHTELILEVTINYFRMLQG